MHVGNVHECIPREGVNSALITIHEKQRKTGRNCLGACTISNIVAEEFKGVAAVPPDYKDIYIGQYLLTHAGVST